MSLLSKVCHRAKYIVMWFSCKRAISVLVVLTMLSETCFAQVPGLSLEHVFKAEAPRLTQLEIPAELASVEEFWEAPSGKNSKVILQIQNAHTNYEAQGKIRDLIAYLEKNYGFKTVFVEGASENLNPDFLKLFPDAETNRKLWDELAKRGQITGADWFLLEQLANNESRNTSHELSGNPIGVGIEDAELYRKNYEALKAVYSREAETTRFLSGLESELDKLATTILDPETRKIISEWKKFEHGHREFLPFVAQLEKWAKEKLGFDLHDFNAQFNWPQLTRLLVLQEMESKLEAQRGQTEIERQKMIAWMKDHGVRGELIEGLVRFNESDISMNRIRASTNQKDFLPRFFIEKLITEAGPKGLRFSDYPNFALYAGYMILKYEIELTALFNEIQKLFAGLLDQGGIASQEAQKLLVLFRDAELLRKLFNLELTRDEWRQAKARRAELNPAQVFGRVKEEAVSSAPVSDYQKEILVAFENAFQFYDFAVQREEVFAQKIADELKSTDRAILMTGGFHTEGLKQFFHEKEISYGTLTPRLNKIEKSNLYREVMLGKSEAGIQTIEIVSRSESRVAQEAQGATIEQIRIGMAGAIETIVPNRTEARALLETYMTGIEGTPARSESRNFSDAEFEKLVEMIEAPKTTQELIWALDSMPKHLMERSPRAHFRSATGKMLFDTILELIEKTPRVHAEDVIGILESAENSLKVSQKAVVLIPFFFKAEADMELPFEGQEALIGTQENFEKILSLFETAKGLEYDLLQVIPRVLYVAPHLATKDNMEVFKLYLPSRDPENRQLERFFLARDPEKRYPEFWPFTRLPDFEEKSFEAFLKGEDFLKGRARSVKEDLYDYVGNVLFQMISGSSIIPQSLQKENDGAVALGRLFMVLMQMQESLLDPEKYRLDPVRISILRHWTQSVVWGNALEYLPVEKLRVVQKIPDEWPNLSDSEKLEVIHKKLKEVRDILRDTYLNSRAFPNTSSLSSESQIPRNKNRSEVRTKLSKKQLLAIMLGALVFAAGITWFSIKSKLSSSNEQAASVSVAGEKAVPIKFASAFTEREMFLINSSLFLGADFMEGAAALKDSRVNEIIIFKEADVMKTVAALIEKGAVPKDSAFTRINDFYTANNISIDAVTITIYDRETNQFKFMVIIQNSVFEKSFARGLATLLHEQAMMIQSVRGLQTDPIQLEITAYQMVAEALKRILNDRDLKEELNPETLRDIENERQYALDQAEKWTQGFKRPQLRSEAREVYEAYSQKLSSPRAEERRSESRTDLIVRGEIAVYENRKEAWDDILNLAAVRPNAQVVVLTSMHDDGWMGAADELEQKYPPVLNGRMLMVSMRKEADNPVFYVLESEISQPFINPSTQKNGELVTIYHAASGSDLLSILKYGYFGLPGRIAFFTDPKIAEGTVEAIRGLYQGVVAFRVPSERLIVQNMNEQTIKQGWSAPAFVLDGTGVRLDEDIKTKLNPKSPTGRMLLRAEKGGFLIRFPPSAIVDVFGFPEGSIPRWEKEEVNKILRVSRTEAHPLAKLHTDKISRSELRFERWMSVARETLESMKGYIDSYLTASDGMKGTAISFVWVSTLFSIVWGATIWFAAANWTQFFLPALSFKTFLTYVSIWTPVALFAHELAHYGTAYFYWLQDGSDATKKANNFQQQMISFMGFNFDASMTVALSSLYPVLNPASGLSVFVGVGALIFAFHMALSVNDFRNGVRILLGKEAKTVTNPTGAKRSEARGNKLEQLLEQLRAQGWTGQDPRTWRVPDFWSEAKVFSKEVTRMELGELGNSLKESFFSADKLNVVPSNLPGLKNFKGEEFLRKFLQHLTEEHQLIHYIDHALLRMSIISDKVDYDERLAKYQILFTETLRRWDDILPSASRSEIRTNLTLTPKKVALVVGGAISILGIFAVAVTSMPIYVVGAAVLVFPILVYGAMELSRRARVGVIHALKLNPQGVEASGQRSEARSKILEALVTGLTVIGILAGTWSYIQKKAASLPSEPIYSVLSGEPIEVRSLNYVAENRAGVFEQAFSSSPLHQCVFAVVVSQDGSRIGAAHFYPYINHQIVSPYEMDAQIRNAQDLFEKQGVSLAGNTVTLFSIGESMVGRYDEAIAEGFRQVSDVVVKAYPSGTGIEIVVKPKGNEWKFEIREGAIDGGVLDEGKIKDGKLIFEKSNGRSEMREISRRAFLSKLSKGLLAASVVAAIPDVVQAAVSSGDRLGSERLLQRAKELNAEKIKEIALKAERQQRSLASLDASVQKILEEVFPREMLQRNPKAFQALREMLLAIIHHESGELKYKIQRVGKEKRPAFIAVGLSQIEVGPSSSKTGQDMISRYLAYPDTKSTRWNEIIRQGAKRYLARALGLPATSESLNDLSKKFVHEFGGNAENKLGLILAEKIIQNDEVDVFFAVMKVVRQLSARAKFDRATFIGELDKLALRDNQARFRFYEKIYRGAGYSEKIVHPLTNDLQVVSAYLKMAPSSTFNKSAVFGNQSRPVTPAAESVPLPAFFNANDVGDTALAENDRKFWQDEERIADNLPPILPSLFRGTLKTVGEYKRMIQGDNSIEKYIAIIFLSSFAPWVVSSITSVFVKKEAVSKIRAISGRYALWSSLIMVMGWAIAILGFNAKMGDKAILMGSFGIFVLVGIIYFFTKVDHHIRYGKLKKVAQAIKLSREVTGLRRKVAKSEKKINQLRDERGRFTAKRSESRFEELKLEPGETAIQLTDRGSWEKLASFKRPADISVRDVLVGQPFLVNFLNLDATAISLNLNLCTGLLFVTSTALYGRHSFFEKTQQIENDIASLGDKPDNVESTLAVLIGGTDYQSVPGIEERRASLQNRLKDKAVFRGSVLSIVPNQADSMVEALFNPATKILYLKTIQRVRSEIRIEENRRLNNLKNIAEEFLIARGFKRQTDGTFINESTFKKDSLGKRRRVIGSVFYQLPGEPITTAGRYSAGEFNKDDYFALALGTYDTGWWVFRDLLALIPGLQYLSSQTALLATAWHEYAHMRLRSYLERNLTVGSKRLDIPPFINEAFAGQFFRFSSTRQAKKNWKAIQHVKPHMWPGDINVFSAQSYDKTNPRLKKLFDIQAHILTESDYYQGKTAQGVFNRFLGFFGLGRLEPMFADPELLQSYDFLFQARVRLANEKTRRAALRSASLQTADIIGVRRSESRADELINKTAEDALLSMLGQLSLKPGDVVHEIGAGAPSRNKTTDYLLGRGQRVRIFEPSSNHYREWEKKYWKKVPQEQKRLTLHREYQKFDSAVDRGNVEAVIMMSVLSDPGISESVKKRILDQIVSMLKPGGYLITGHYRVHDEQFAEAYTALQENEVELHKSGMEYLKTVANLEPIEQGQGDTHLWQVYRVTPKKQVIDFEKMNVTGGVALGPNVLLLKRAELRLIPEVITTALAGLIFYSKEVYANEFDTVQALARDEVAELYPQELKTASDEIWVDIYQAMPSSEELDLIERILKENPNRKIKLAILGAVDRQNILMRFSTFKTQFQLLSETALRATLNSGQSMLVTLPDHLVDEIKVSASLEKLVLVTYSSLSENENKARLMVSSALPSALKGELAGQALETQPGVRGKIEIRKFRVSYLQSWAQKLTQLFAALKTVSASA